MRRLRVEVFVSLIACLGGCETRSPLSVEPNQRQTALAVAPLALKARVLATPLVAHFKVVSEVSRQGTVGTQKAEAIFTDLTLHVLTLVHGNADQVVVLSTLGGRVGERAMNVSDQVVLSAGDEAIGFVDPTAAPQPFVGGQRGVLLVRDGRVFSFDGRPLVEVNPEGFVFGRAPDAPTPAPALQPQGTARATRVLPPEGAALTTAEVLSALKASLGAR